MNRVIRWLAPIGLLVALLLALAAPANAQKVGNPGTFNFKITNGVLKVKTQEFGFDASQNINFNGTVNGAGAINIPTMTFPSFPISASGFNLTVHINVVGPTTGTINPLTGDVSLLLRVWIKIDGVPLGGGCKIASASSPITLNTLITGTSGSVTGTPYNPSAGTMKIVNGNYAVPSSSDCGPAAGTVNDTVGLPSSAGNNTAQFDITATPVITRGLTSSLTASPTSGTAPFTTTLNAGGSTAAAGIKEYRWDFTNDGSIDQITTTSSVGHTYTVGGSPTARVVVVDNDNDTAQATRQLTVNAYPDLGLSVAHTGDFRVGNTETYRVNLQNVGYAATSGPVTVTSTLPAGLTYNSATGSGWGCSASGQDLTCTRAASIAVGANAPELGVNVNPGVAGRPEVTPVFTVSTAGDNGPGNNSAADQTNVTATDLKLSLSHPSHAILPGADPANLIHLSVENIGDAATVGPTVVTDELPTGLAPVSATGTGWSCDITGQTVTCTRAAAIAAGATSDEIEIAVSGSLDAGVLGVTVDNEASVATADDVDPSNDTATDPTLILDGQDVGISKSHSGSFTAGKPAHYTLEVKNFGTQPTTGPTVVTDVLPAGLTFSAADGGSDWACLNDSGTVTCTHAGVLAAGADAAPIDLTVDVGVDAIPAVTNTASVATPDDPNPANDSSSDEAVVQAIDLQITKDHTGVIRVGKETTYRLGVTNVGDSATTATSTVTDVLPAGLTFVSADGGTDWSCSESSGTVTCDNTNTIEPGQSAADISLRVMVDSAAAPTVSNSASVATLDDFNPANDSATDTADAIDVDTSVSIGRTGTFRPGHNGTYQISVRNEGTVASAGDTEVSAVLPPGLEFVSASGTGWNCTEDNGLVTCSLVGGLAGETTAPAISLRVLVTTAAVPSVTTAVTATTAGDRYQGNDEASDEASVSAADLAIAISHGGDFRVGDENIWTIDLTNGGGAGTAGTVTVNATVPAGVDPVGAEGLGWQCAITGQDVTCSRDAAIAAGGSAPSISLSVRPTALALDPGEASGNATLEATVSTDNDSDAGNDSASDQASLIAVDQAVTMTGPNTLATGEEAVWQIQVENTGTAATRGGTTVTDSLPTGFGATSSGGDGWVCSSAAGEITCTHDAESAPGTQLEPLTIRARAGRGAAGTATNAVAIESAGDVDPGNDSASLDSEVTAAADLEANLEARTAAFRVGGDAGYELKIRNVGSADAAGPTTVTLDLPAGATFVNSDHGQGWSCDEPAGSQVTCENPDSIPVDQISTLGFHLTFGKSTAANATVEATVENGADNNPANDESSLTSPVGRIDLVITRVQNGEWVRPGTGSDTIKVKNRGTVATVGPVTLTETLPYGTTLASAQGENWSCRVSGRILSCVNREQIAPSEISSLIVTFDIARLASTPVSTRTAVATVDDVDPSNDVTVERIELVDATLPDPSRATIRGGKATATASGLVTVWMSCPQDAAVKCRGELQLKTSGKVKVKKTKKGKFRKAKLNLGQADFALAAGQSAPVQVQVTGQGRKALKLNRKIKAVATAVGEGVSPSKARITIARSR